MKTTKITHWLPVEDILKKYESEEDKWKKKKWLCIYLWTIKSRTRLELARDSMLWLWTVKKLTAWYNKKWPSYIESNPWKWWDRRNKKIDRKSEKEFFEWLISDAVKWKHNTIKWIEQGYREKINPNLWKWVIFSILHRFERKKKVPRTYHEKKTKKM